MNVVVLLMCLDDPLGLAHLKIMDVLIALGVSALSFFVGENCFIAI